MKKMIVTLVAMMAVTFSFAETNSNNVDRRFDMSCNMDVETIHDNFNNELKSLASVRGPIQRHMVHQAVRKDAQKMKNVLNKEQFGLYMRIMLNTLRNRQL